MDVCAKDKRLHGCVCIKTCAFCIKNVVNINRPSNKYKYSKYKYFEPEMPNAMVAKVGFPKGVSKAKWDAGHNPERVSSKLSPPSGPKVPHSDWLPAVAVRPSVFPSWSQGSDENTLVVNFNGNTWFY